MSAVHECPALLPRGAERWPWLHGSSSRSLFTTAPEITPKTKVTAFSLNEEKLQGPSLRSQE